MLKCLIRIYTLKLWVRFKDRYKTFVPEIAVKGGFMFVFSEILGVDVGYSFESSITDIEDKNAVDNLGRKLWRFTNLSEKYIGDRASTIMQKNYFYFGIVFFVGYKTN